VISNRDKKYIKRNILARLDGPNACVTRIEESLLSPEQTVLHRKRGYYVPYGFRWKIQNYVPNKDGRKIGTFKEISLLSEKQIEYIKGLIKDNHLIKKFSKREVYERNPEKKLVVTSDELSKAQQKTIRRMRARTNSKKTCYLVVEHEDKRKTRNLREVPHVKAYLIDIDGFAFSHWVFGVKNKTESNLAYDSAKILADHKEVLTHIYTTGEDYTLIKVYTLNETQEAWEKKTVIQKLSQIVNHRACPNNGLCTCKSCASCPMATSGCAFNNSSKSELAAIFKDLREQLQTTKKLAFLEKLGADTDGKNQESNDSQAAAGEEKTPQAAGNPP
jgi:hypothetical protein